MKADLPDPGVLKGLVELLDHMYRLKGQVEDGLTEDECNGLWTATAPLVEERTA